MKPLTTITLLACIGALAGCNERNPIPDENLTPQELAEANLVYCMKKRITQTGDRCHVSVKYLEVLELRRIADALQ